MHTELTFDDGTTATIPQTPSDRSAFAIAMKSAERAAGKRVAAWRVVRDEPEPSPP